MRGDGYLRVPLKSTTVAIPLYVGLGMVSLLAPTGTSRGKPVLAKVAAGISAKCRLAVGGGAILDKAIP